MTHEGGTSPRVPRAGFATQANSPGGERGVRAIHSGGIGVPGRAVHQTCRPGAKRSGAATAPRSDPGPGDRPPCPAEARLKEALGRVTMPQSPRTPLLQHARPRSHQDGRVPLRREGAVAGFMVSGLDLRSPERPRPPRPSPAWAAWSWWRRRTPGRVPPQLSTGVEPAHWGRRSFLRGLSGETFHV